MPAVRGRRTLVAAVRGRAREGRLSRVQRRRIAWALARTVIAALLALPFAVIWGIGHARIVDYLGPHRATYAATYDGRIDLDLGPIGNAYLPSPVAPVGLAITVGGVGEATETLTSLFSDETLAAYASLYTEPQEIIRGVVERLEIDALAHTLRAEALILLVFAVWSLRRRLWSPWLVGHVSRRQVTAVYLTVVAVLAGSILSPRPDGSPSYPVTAAAGSRFADLRVDSRSLADLIDRGLAGVELLSGRQQAAVDTYVENAYASLSEQQNRWPAPGPGESMLMGYSDLHCNHAMIELLVRLERAVHPAAVLSSGDDTVNGTAAERGCISRESAIGQGVPFVVATGNHDSDVTESQMKADKMTVLDGAVVDAGGLKVLGDDDPEHNIPFSVERVHDRPESEEQMAERLLGVARTHPTDVILVHQPTASFVIMQAQPIPARLVLWGHMHAEFGPTVVTHPDGSWTVGMQEGTAGGVRQPTLTSFSTPFSPPLVSADVYFYFRDQATGLVTAVQPVHFLPSGTVVIDQRLATGDLAKLPEETRRKLTGETSGPVSATPSDTAAPSAPPAGSAVPSDTPGG